MLSFANDNEHGKSWCQRVNSKVSAYAPWCLLSAVYVALMDINAKYAGFSASQNEKVISVSKVDVGREGNGARGLV